MLSNAFCKHVRAILTSKPVSLFCHHSYYLRISIHSLLLERRFNMGSFTNGVLVGLGVSLLIAPMKGEEMRHLVAERVRYLRGIPPENPELQQSLQQMSDRVQSVQQMADHASQMGTAAQESAQQTTTNARSVQRDLGNVARRAGEDVPQTRQGDTSPTKPVRPIRPTS
jgi:gas vesicle protein